MNIIEWSDEFVNIFRDRSIHKGSFSGNKTEWYNLLKYMIQNDKDLKAIKNWPDNFLNDNLIKSLKGNKKFNL